MRRIPVLYENNACLILNKPSGLAVQGGEGVTVSLDSILSQSYKDRPLLVHRLDKDTSGIILVAKEREAAAVFSGLITSFDKRYLAVAAGIPHPSKGIIRLDLDIRGKKRKSETTYRLLASSEKANLQFVGETTYSLLELELGSGRMHQIRRHLCMIKHPILGDDKYGDFSLNKILRKNMGLKRLLLHASRLIIPRIPSYFPDGLDISAAPPDYFYPFFPESHLSLLTQ